MSRDDRNCAVPPSCVMPASNETRVRVDAFSKIIARIFPESAVRNSAGRSFIRAARAKRAATSAGVRSWIETRSFLNMPSLLHRIAYERHRHAARPPARAGQLGRREQDRVLAAFPQVERLPSEQEIVVRDDRVPLANEGIRGALVPVVAENDAGRERERVRAVGPLFALLVDRIGAAAE